MRCWCLCLLLSVLGVTACASSPIASSSVARPAAVSAASLDISASTPKVTRASTSAKSACSDPLSPCEARLTLALERCSLRLHAAERELAQRDAEEPTAEAWLGLPGWAWLGFGGAGGAAVVAVLLLLGGAR